MLNDIFSYTKIAGIVFLIVIGFLLGGDAGAIDAATNPMIKPEDFNLISAMFTAMLMAFWAYDGWINLAYMGGEVKNPKKNIPIAIIGGTAAVMIIYVVVNYVYMRVMPINNFIEINSAGT